MSENLKFLRYNTGNDKKAFIEFKEDFDAVIFNASIVAYSGAAVSDIISVHMKRYVIDPQTHILQQETKDFMSPTKADTIKSSVAKYFKQLPSTISNVLVQERRPLTLNDLSPQIDSLALAVYDFQTKYINQFLEEKEYNKFIDFYLEEKKINKGYSPKFIIAPYFRIKKEYSDIEKQQWLRLNADAINSFLTIKNKDIKDYEVAAELLLDQQTLLRIDVDLIKQAYNIEGYEYVFLWIDEFTPLDANEEMQRCFKKLVLALKSINKKVIMAYGGFDSIFLCHSEIESKLYGVAQSVGYGESRKITPVSGGLPVNKYYFYPMHKRIDFGDASNKLLEAGYLRGDRREAANMYYKDICDCWQCRDLIKNDINGFNKYNDSVPYAWKGNIKKNRPTTEASYIATKHFMFSKSSEWKLIEGQTKDEIIEKLIANFKKFGTSADITKLRRFLKIYAE